MEQQVCCLFPFLSKGQILQLVSVVGRGEGLCWCFVCVLPLMLMEYLVDGDQGVHGSEGYLATSGASGTAKMGTITTSEIQEAFQYAFISRFANTGTFQLFLTADFSQKCFCFISIPQSDADYCVADVPLQGAGKQLPSVKADIFCDAVYYQCSEQQVRRILCLMRESSSLFLFNCF